jgi:MarR-like DNA-binding transcriptional regulator SgrR of sgrS sRNA
MNRFSKVFINLAVLSMLISGCNQNEKTVTTHSNDKAEKTSIKSEETSTNKKEKSEEVLITAEKGTPDWTFQQLVKAVAEDNLSEFMNFQNEENGLFYKEQARWIEEAIFKKGQGYTLSIEFGGFQKESDTKGRVFLTVKMKHPEGVEECL